MGCGDRRRPLLGLYLGADAGAAAVVVLFLVVADGVAAIALFVCLRHTHTHELRISHTLLELHTFKNGFITNDSN